MASDWESSTNRTRKGRRFPVGILVLAGIGNFQGTTHPTSKFDFHLNQSPGAARAASYDFGQKSNDGLIGLRPYRVRSWWGPRPGDTARRLAIPDMSVLMSPDENIS